MGTWATGPFDNDSAADFAHDVRETHGPAKRQSLLLVTLADGTAYLRSHQAGEWGWELEHAVAAAAFVADEYTGAKQFTNCSYARGVEDDEELSLKPYVEFGPVLPELLTAARVFVRNLMVWMEAARTDREWTDPVSDIRKALNTTV